MRSLKGKRTFQRTRLLLLTVAKPFGSGIAVQIKHGRGSRYLIEQNLIYITNAITQRAKYQYLGHRMIPLSFSLEFLDIPNIF